MFEFQFTDLDNNWKVSFNQQTEFFRDFDISLRIIKTSPVFQKS